MSSSETLLRAAFNRLTARLQSKITSSASETTAFMKKAPDQLKKEWDEFKEEIVAEAQKLDSETNETNSWEEISFKGEDSLSQQKKIDLLRKKIAELTNKMEELL